MSLYLVSYHKKMKYKKALLNQRNILILVIIFLILAFQFNLFKTGFIGQVENYQDTDDIKYQFAGDMPLWEETCEPWDTSDFNTFIGNSRTVNTAKSEFRFEVSKVHRYVSSRSATATVTYQADVYKDGTLIDTIYDIPNGMPIPDDPDSPAVCIGQELGGPCGPNPTGQDYYRAYADSGVVYKAETVTPRLFTSSTKVELPQGETGLNVYFGIASGTGSNRCGDRDKAYIVHRYIVVGGTPTGTGEVTEDEPEETVECTDNVGCIDVCGNDVPTCLNNECYCGDDLYTETKSKSLIEKFNDFINNLIETIRGWFT